MEERSSAADIAGGLGTNVYRGPERRRLGEQLRQRVSELEQANEKELDRLKSQFMSIASHELKTPITAMSGFLQVTLRRVRKRLESPRPQSVEEQRALLDQLEIVQRQTAKLARLVDELLDVSRIQSGRIEFSISEVDLVSLAGEVADRMRVVSAHHDVKVHSDGPVVVDADRDHLEQVFNNLVGNAIKYSPGGGAVDVHVRASNGAALISVRDRGIGIPAEELQEVFGLFYRSPDRRARDVGGMGLGLFISKQIVDRHGGRIWADSTPGQGTTFSVELPRHAIVAPDDAPNAVGSSATYRPGGDATFVRQYA